VFSATASYASVMPVFEVVQLVHSHSDPYGARRRLHSARENRRGGPTSQAMRGAECKVLAGAVIAGMQAALLIRQLTRRSRLSAHNVVCEWPH